MTTNLHPDCKPDYLVRSELEALQLHRLQMTVQRCFEHVPLFRSRMEEQGLVPGDIQTLADLIRIPFTRKSDLRDTYPYGLFAVPMNEVVRLHASSGTTGKPIVVGYTQKDLEIWSRVMLRSFVATGLTENDILQNAYGYGLFTGGLGAHYGAERLGATVIPISGGHTERQILVMKDFGVTAICCTPSYFIHLIERVKSGGIDFSELKVKIGIFGAEPWTEGMRSYIQRESGIKAFDIYGLSEIIGPGVGIECTAQCGLHIFEDHFLIEIINPETGELLSDGQEGELVITTLTKEAFPMIRYRTHDITSILPGSCVCGRTLRRISRIRSRSDDMMIIRGVNVFPSQIESALLAVEGTVPHYLILLTRKGGLDQMEVQVEMTRALSEKPGQDPSALQKKLAEKIEETVGLRVPVQLVDPDTLSRSEGKAKRVLDLRGQAEDLR